MITAQAVRDALRGRFGSFLADDPGFFDGVLRVLRAYSPARDSFASLSLRMEDYLFNALYERLGPGMTCRLEDGSFRRFLLSDLPAAADEALFPLFVSLKPYSVSYDHLHRYWMESGSFSAMRALYRNYQEFLPAQERFLIERIVRENIPAPDQEAWLAVRSQTQPESGSGSTLDGKDSPA